MIYYIPPCIYDHEHNVNACVSVVVTTIDIIDYIYILYKNICLYGKTYYYSGLVCSVTRVAVLISCLSV